MQRPEEFGYVGTWVPVKDGSLVCPRTQATQPPEGCLECGHYLRWRPNAIEDGDEAILCDYLVLLIIVGLGAMAEDDPV